MKINHATFFDIKIHNCAYVYENIQLQTWSSSTLLTLGFWMDLNVSLQQQLGGGGVEYLLYANAEIFNHCVKE